MNETLDYLCKRNYKLEIVEFLKFLREKVLVVDESNRINPKKIQKKIQDNKLLTRLLFEGKIDSDSEEELELDETYETNEIMTNTLVTSSTFKYYNPFDFLPNQQA